MWKPIEREAAERTLSGLGYDPRVMAMLEKDAYPHTDLDLCEGYVHGRLEGPNDRRWRLVVDSNGQWWFRYID